MGRDPGPRASAPAPGPTRAAPAAPGAASDDDHPLEEVAELGGRSLIGLGALIVGALPFLALLALVEARWPPLHRLDTAVVDALNAAVAASPVAVRALSVLTDAGGGATAGFVLTLAGACLVIRRRVRLAAYLAVAGVGLAILSPVTKALVGRARPEVALPVVDLPTNASFPSGHAMTSAVTWGALLLVALPGLRPVERRLWTAVTALVVLTVGFTRVALGVHFVSDVLAGWGLGIAWLAVVTVAFRRWLRDRGDPVAPVGAGVVLGPVSDGVEPALPDGGTTLARLVAGWGAVLLVVVVLGLLVAGPPSGGAVGQGDPSPAGTGSGVRGPWPAAAVAGASSLSAPQGVVMAAVAGAALGAAALRSWRPVVLLVSAAGGAVLLAGAAGAVVGRLRPDLDDVDDLAGLGDLAALAGWAGGVGAGYPSARIAAAAAVLGALALLAVTASRRRWRWGVVVGAVVVVTAAAAQLAASTHRLADVVGGMVLGCLWLAVLHRALPTRRTPGADATAPPPPTYHHPSHRPRREARP